MQQRWFRYQPDAQAETTTKKRKKPQSKQPSKSAKRTRVESDDNDPGDAEEEPEDSDEDIDKREISVYIYVSAPPPPVTRVSRGKAPQPKITPCGPITLNAAITYDDFLVAVAVELKCHSPACLNLSAMEWKFDRPGTAKYKQIMNEIGFKVMIKTILDRKKDFVISLQLPPPTRYVSNTVSSSISDRSLSFLSYLAIAVG